MNILLGINKKKKNMNVNKNIIHYNNINPLASFP